MYSGLIIKESIMNEQILDKLDVVSVELWKTDNKPKYWTAISFTSNYEDFPKHLSNALALSSESGLVGIIFDRVTTFSFINISEIRDKTYAFYEIHMVEVYSKSVCFLLQK